MSERMRGIRPYIALQKHLDLIDKIRRRQLRFRVLFVYGIIFPMAALALLAFLVASEAVQ